MSRQGTLGEQDSPTTAASGAERPSGATLAEGVGGDTVSPEVPVPGPRIEAPIHDLVTIRLAELVDPKGVPYIRARAYVRGAQIGVTNATSTFAALAGASADIESALRTAELAKEDKRS